jgi:putative DNA primase/helicase
MLRETKAAGLGTAAASRSDYSGQSTMSEALASACAEVGIIYRDVPADGQWHKTDIDGDPRGRGDGRIKLFADGEGGIVCNWKGETVPFFVDDGRKLTEAERRDRERKRAESIRRAREEEARRHAAGAMKASAIWKAAQPAPCDHPYLTRKQTQAHGARLYRGPLVVDGMPCDGSLIVPACDGSGAIHTLEFIHPEKRDGDNKRFLPGGDYRGRYFSIGTMEGAGPLCLSEGFATGASYAVAAAFNAGNLGPVAKALRARFPSSRLILCADDDAATDGNPGLIKAISTAHAVAGLLAVPDFGENRPSGMTDFNDMHQHRGREAVAECIRRQMATSSAQDGTPPGSEEAPGGDSQDKDGPREARDGQGEALGSAKASSGGQTRPNTGTAPGDAEVIEMAIVRLSTDIGAIFEPAVITALKSVRESKPADYQRYRRRIKDAGASVAELDRLVCVPEEKGDDAQGAPVLFPDIEPSPKPVDGAKLLTDLAATCRRYVVLTKYADTAIALWVVFTHAIGFVDIAPILAITSPEKRCGKSTVLAMLMRLVLRPLPAANLTSAALFRAIQAWAPTLLIDEADTFTQNSDELRGIINSGHTRELAYVIRTVGDDHEPRKFSTWGAKAIASIGKLSDTNADRSIEIPLQRKLPGERTERLRHADPPTLHNLASRCVRWVIDHAEEIRAARPSMPETLHDRAQDNWEPLIAIADLAGGDWPKLSREAALALSGAGDAENDNIRVQLLSDIRRVFTSTQRDRLPTVELIDELKALDGRPWGEVNRGKRINPHWLAARLRAFGIVRGTKRSEKVTFKGYTIDQFSDAFARYLPPEDPPSDRSHGHNADGARDAADFGKVTPDECDRSENAPEPSCGVGCDRVTDPDPPPWAVRL